jgi:L-rhamnose isomerase / sugar isomerase
LSFIAYAQALLVERTALSQYQHDNDVLMAARILKRAFRTDVGPILARARRSKGAAVDPIAAYRASGYRSSRAAARPVAALGGSGIV